MEPAPGKYCFKQNLRNVEYIFILKGGKLLKIIFHRLIISKKKTEYKDSYHSVDTPPQECLVFFGDAKVMRQVFKAISYF